MSGARAAEVPSGRMLESLSSELARLEAMIDAAPVAFYQADERDRVTFANAELRRLLDDRLPEGRPLREAYADPDHRDTLLRRLREEGGEASLITTLRNGARVEERARLRRTDDGVVVVEGVLADVSEQLDFERELDRYARMLDDANRQLKRHVSVLDAFTYTVSHDLKTPLRGILAYLDAYEEDLAAAGVRPPPEAQEHLAHARRAGKLMEEMIRGVLEVARFQRLPQEGRCDTAKAVDEVLAAHDHDIRAARAEVALRGPRPVLPVAPDVFRAVLMNLFGNALKYSNDERPFVRVEAEEDADQVVFTVADNGPGVAPEHRTRVFDLFYRTPASKAEGTGAGLAIARMGVEGWNGRIWVDDAPEGGAAFHFTVPTRRLA